MPSLTPAVEQLIRELDLAPHPEGGWFRETYRSTQVDPHGRAASTLIYFLLAADRRSRLHRIDADEGWHLYRGGPVEIFELDEAAPDGALRVTRLGNELERGERPQHVVPAGRWFGAALPDGVDYALIGCSVAPGFEFARFELADRRRMLARFGMHRALVEHLTCDDP
jgi:predicted cupin superfamily sugar epimerase